MSGDTGDEALRWEGDVDSSYVPVTAAPARPTGAPGVEPVSTAPAVGPASADSAVEVPSADPAAQVVSARAGTGSFLLVTYGILAGAYLIYTIGWLLPIVTHTRPANPDLLGEFMVRLAQVLAIAAPAIWYGASLLLTRGRRPIVRLLALLGGLVVLLPWPYLLLGV